MANRITSADLDRKIAWANECLKNGNRGFRIVRGGRYNQTYLDPVRDGDPDYNTAYDALYGGTIAGCVEFLKAFIAGMTFTLPRK